MPLVLLLLLAGGRPLPAPVPAPHPLSYSRLEVNVGSRSVTVELRVQARTLEEAGNLQLDADGDELVSRAEVEARWPAVRAYLAARLSVAWRGAPARLPFETPAFEDLPDFLPMGGADSPFFGWLIARARVPVTWKPQEIQVAFRLFFDQGNPDHRIYLTVTGLTREPERILLDAGTPAIGFPLSSGPPGASGKGLAGTLWVYLQLGWEHVLDGLDHLGFVAGLLLGVGSLRMLLVAVTAFTMAHSITLAVSALGIFALEPRLVEPGIALSVLLVVWLHLLQGPGRARPARVAFPFGLLHGFGFAGALGQAGLPPDARLPALLGFNLGVEAGQLTFVLPLVFAGALVSRRFPRAAAERVRLLAGVLLGALGLQLTARTLDAYWLGDRLAFLPAALRPLPAALLLLLGLGLWLRSRSTPRGSRLLPELFLSGLVFAFFLAGRAWAGFQAAG
ncbi:MAG: HupE/UreJ family protein [Planctomycetota bacterium]